MFASITTSFFIWDQSHFLSEQIKSRNKSDPDSSLATAGHYSSRLGDPPSGEEKPVFPVRSPGQ